MRAKTVLTFVVALLACSAWACSDPGAVGQPDLPIQTDGLGWPDVKSDTSTVDSATPTDSTAPDGQGDAGDTASPGDTAQPDVPVELCPGGFGCPCTSHADCTDEFCIEGADGYLCTKPCVTSCPDGFDCVSTTAFSSDPISICVPRHIRLCAPCNSDDDCDDPFAVAPGYCMQGEDASAGSFCGSSCDFGINCPEGYSCVDHALEGGQTVKQCKKTEGECACTDHWASLGLSTPCAVENGEGSCDGLRICTAEGLTECQASTPGVETCNGEDDDCNGVVDDIQGEACTTTSAAGTCAGSMICGDAGEPVCNAPLAVEETCNGIDDDCDGIPDEDTCSDGLACTLDICSPDGVCSNTLTDGFCLIDGACVQEGGVNPGNPCQQCLTEKAPNAWSNGVGLACNDASACSHTDTCILDGSCVGTAYVCDDGLNCTGDLCDGQGGCSHKITDGHCAISGICYADAEVSDQNGCKVCNVSLSNESWSNALSGTLCDDGEACTSSDKCQSGGQCAGIEQSCDDGKWCTVDSCDGAGGCDHVPSGGCLIGNSCYQPGTANPSNPCEECNPNLATTGWSPASGAACNDGQSCTHSDTCQAGACIGVSYSCNDSLSCTTDACNGSGGCKNTIKGGKCLIGGTCYSAGSTKPGNSCEVCNASAPKAWSDNDNAGCDDGNACTKNDVCGGGSCAGTAIVDGYEGNDTKGAATNLGSVNDNADYPKGAFTASLYGSGDQDWYKFYDNDVWNGAIYPRVDLKNIPVGSNYKLCAYYSCSDLSLSCKSGTSSTYDGMKGCCSNNAGSANEMVRLDPNCSGLDDSGTVYVRVTRVSGSWTCNAYTLQWGDD